MVEIYNKFSVVFSVKKSGAQVMWFVKYDELNVKKFSKILKILKIFKKL